MPYQVGVYFGALERSALFSSAKTILTRMNHLLRFVFASATMGLSLLSGASYGQLLRPLPAAPVQPVETPVARRTQALALPFFDDFSDQREGSPTIERWQAAGGTLVNNRFPRRPPSRNAATLDGLNGRGAPYNSTASIGNTDSLISQPIDLSGLTPADNVFLSFYWQAGSIFGPPFSASTSRAIGLYVDFKDEAGNWTQVWGLRSQGDTSIFRFKALPVNQAAYLHGSFQFRIRTIGSQYNSRDAWSIDYVRLDRNRTATDSTFRDIATSRALPSALKRYAAMPWQQFNLNPTQELNDQAGTTANNLDPGPAPTPITWTGTLEVLPGGPTRQYLTGGASLSAGLEGRQVPVRGDIRLGAPGNLPAARQLRQRVTLITNETNPLTLRNDTISRVTELADYYAYDDGTPEASISLPISSGGPQTYYATRFDLNGADFVRAILIYPFPTSAGRTITVNIWDDNNGSPAASPKASKSTQITAAQAAAQQFVEVRFDAPVAVGTRFYAGYGQGSSTQFVEFGVDLNNASPAGAFFLNTANAWGPVSLVQAGTAGAVMLRPVMGNTVTTATAPAAVAAYYSLYPNPTTDGHVQVEGRYSHALVLDALGRTVWEQPVAQAGQATLDLGQLPAGVYLVRLLLPDGLTVTKRLVRQQ